jgi:hypothetical protein
MEQSMSSDQIDQRRRRHFIEGLRAVADFYEQNVDAYYDGMCITLNMCMGRHGASHAARDGPGIWSMQQGLR